jgi:hypothetical protein
MVILIESQTKQTNRFHRQKLRTIDHGIDKNLLSWYSGGFRMNFTQWQIEIKNNLQVIIDKSKRLQEKPEEITKPDIKRLYDYVNALDQMYENIKEVTS